MQKHPTRTLVSRAVLSACALTLLTSAAAYAQPAEQLPPPPPPPPPAAEPAAPLPPPEPPKPVVEAAKPAPALPAALSVGTKATFKPGLLLQTWNLFERTSNAAGDSVSADTFRIRRAEFTAKGDIVPKLFTYAFMFDAARLLDPQDTKLATTPAITIRQPVGNGILQDVFVTYLSDYADVSMGQFKIPVGWESYNSTAKTLFPERSIVSVAFADRRDIGLRIAKTFDMIGYSAGFFNGAGQNALDSNKSKDGALRLELYPVKGMTIAGVVYGTLWDTTDLGARRRYEGDLRYENGPFLFQGEYFNARDRKAKAATSAVPTAFSNTLVKGQGFYAAGGFKLIENLQLCFRYDYLDPDTDSAVDKDQTKGYEGQLVYYLQGQEAKFSLVYSRFQYASGSNKEPLNQVLFAAQLWY
jgi:hypothetical protein